MSHKRRQRRQIVIENTMQTGNPTAEPSHVYRNNKRNELSDPTVVARSNTHCPSINIQTLRV